MDSVSGDTTWAFYENLVPDTRYLFALTAIDETGAWDPVFNRNTSVLAFRPAFTGNLGPILTLFSDFFRYTYFDGGFQTDASRYICVEVLTDVVIRMNWSAVPPEGASMRRYRWALDIEDLGDETPRADETRDVSHWSRWSLNTTSAFLGPFIGDPRALDAHFFYVEAEDNIGLMSLGIVQLKAVPFTRDRPLLIVDDRRGTPNRYVTLTQVGPPAGSWPTEAELDTFYYARGGFRWKGYRPENGLPQQLRSPPGVFLGYDYDTFDTRGLLDPVLPIGVLARYQNIIWYTDAASANMTDGPFEFNPKTLLRQMTGPDRFNTLPLFLKKGGRLLMFGGGIVTATVREWGNVGADFTTAPDPKASLLPGRFPYDVLHMRAGMKVAQITRVDVSSRRPAAFAGLVSLRHRSATDPLPPFHTSVPRYPWVEYLNQAFHLVEDANPDPSVFDSLQVLDTLYTAHGGLAFGQPCGFYYHGADNPPIIYLGFDLWIWQRAQIIQTIDVLLARRVGAAAAEPRAVAGREAPEASARAVASPTAPPPPSP